MYDESALNTWLNVSYMVIWCEHHPLLCLSLTIELVGSLAQW